MLWNNSIIVLKCGLKILVNGLQSSNYRVPRGWEFVKGEKNENEGVEECAVREANEQRRILYFLVNHAGHDWIFPEKLLCMNDDKQLIIDNIRRRGRKGLKESDEKYLDTIHGLFEKFYSNELIFEHLNPELGEKIMRIPKHLIKGMDDLNKVMKLLEE